MNAARAYTGPLRVGSMEDAFAFDPHTPTPAEVEEFFIGTRVVSCPGVWLTNDPDLLGPIEVEPLPTPPNPPEGCYGDHGGEYGRWVREIL